MKSHRNWECSRLWQETCCPVHGHTVLRNLSKAEVDFAEAEEAVKTGRLQDVLSVELLIVKYSIVPEGDLNVF